MLMATSLTVGGGAELQVRLLAEGLHRRGSDVTVVSMMRLGPAAGPFVEQLRSAGIRVDTLGMRRGRPDPRGLVRLARLLRRIRPDVLHAHMVHANLLARLSRLLVRTPVLVSTMHNQNEGSQWRYVAYRLTHRLSDVTTAVSAEAADEVVARGGAPAGGIRAVPNGLDTASFERDERIRADTRTSLGLDGAFVWLGAGRLVDAKGFPDLLESFARVIARRPDARLLIAGSGPMEGELRERATAMGLDEVVRFLGFRSDLPALMQAADAFVLSSRWEGLPMVLLEATASRLPIVASDVAGSRAAVRDGITGFLVPAADPEALADGMVRVMALQPDALAAMGAAAREHAARTFDLERVLDAWEEIYAERLRDRGDQTVDGATRP